MQLLEHEILNLKGSHLNPTSETLRALVDAYLLISFLVGGAAVTENEIAAARVRDASQHLRDAVASPCMGLMRSDDREEFANLLREASDGKISAHEADGENLKASLLKSCHVLVGNLSSSEPTRSRRKRLSRGESRRRRAIQP